MTPLLFSLEPDLPLRDPLLAQLNAEAGELESRRFPDGETYQRIHSDIRARHCIILADLSDPDSRVLPLIFLAATLKEMGAASVGLLAPYLCYMRQDTRFHPGEVVTSRIFAQLISRELDWLITVDPHLHRYQSLDEIYRIPSVTVAGAPALANWLAEQNEDLLLVGPDIESEQWVSAIAAEIDQPFVVGRKERRGDRDVTVTLPDIQPYRGRTAVIIDDVIASGHTILDTLQALQKAGAGTVDCVSVHGIFADRIDRTLLERGIRRLVTSNSIPHNSNQVDLTPLLVEPIQAIIKTAGY